jgi:beta-lactam-binding protein with PASTA domain
VPKLVGLTLKKARGKLLKAHCRLGKVTKKASSAKKKGRVLSQKPKPGKRLANGAKVKVTIGKGPKK